MTNSHYQGPIVDAHHHFWDPAVNYHPWLCDPVSIPFRYGDYGAIKTRYLPEQYFADAEKHDIQATVYIEAEWDPADPLGETRYVEALAARYGFPNAVVAQAWLNRADIKTVLQRQASCGLVRSIRHKPGGTPTAELAAAQPSLMMDAAWRDGFALLGTYGLHFDLQTPWWHLDEAVLLAQDFPRITIIINHAALPDSTTVAGLERWAAAVGRVAQCPNVVMKVSGMGMAGKPWAGDRNDFVVQACINAFSPQRIMFGSNFPVDKLCASFDEIFSGFKRIAGAYAFEDQADMFFNNARRIYRLA